MFPIGKAIALLLLNKSSSSNKPELFKSLLSGLTVIIVTALFTTILVAALFLAAVCYGHMLLADQIDSEIATGITIVFILAVIGGLIYCINHRIEKLHNAFVDFTDQELPIASQATGVAKSFIDGLLNRPG